jgi:hypothetical protein
MKKPVLIAAVAVVASLSFAAQAQDQSHHQVTMVRHTTTTVRHHEDHGGTTVRRRVVRRHVVRRRVVHHVRHDQAMGDHRTVRGRHVVKSTVTVKTTTH